MSDNDDGQVYRAVVNHEEQYSIWPVHRELPAGWRDTGKQGSKSDCLAYIGDVWTDMRPLSLRKHMEELARQAPAPEPEVTPVDMRPPLVKRLAEGIHSARFSSRPECTVVALKQSIDRGYAHILFPQTQGGTELGIRIDAASSDVSKADFAAGSGEVMLVGNLVLDGVRVQCSATLDLATLEGKGNLRLLD